MKKSRFSAEEQLQARKNVQKKFREKREKEHLFSEFKHRKLTKKKAIKKREPAPSARVTRKAPAKRKRNTSKATLSIERG